MSAAPAHAHAARLGVLQINLEPITHFLTGACLSRAGLNRKTALATATMTLAAEAPDLDVFSGFKGPVVGFAHHRGFTHSFLGLFLVSALVLAVVYLFWRLRGRRTNTPGLPPRWGLLFLLAYGAGLSHILLDFTNNYGVRPLWPLSEKWYSWNVTFIVEPVLLLALIAGLVVPRFWRESTRPRMRRLTARLALLFMAGLWGGRSYEATRTERLLMRERYQSQAPVRASAFPYWVPNSHYFASLRWSAVVETESFFVISEVDPVSGRLGPSRYEVMAKPHETPAILAAKRCYLGRVYLDWAQYPVVTESSTNGDSIVLFRDLRFYYPEMRSNDILTARVRLDSQLNVVEEIVGRRKQDPPF